MLGQSCCKMKVSCCEFRALSFYPILNPHKRLTISEWLPTNHSQKWFNTHNVFSVCQTENTNMPLISSLLEGGKTFWLLDPSVIVAVYTVRRQETKFMKEERTANFVMNLIFCHCLFHSIILGLKTTLENVNFKQKLYSSFFLFVLLVCVILKYMANVRSRI